VKDGIITAIDSAANLPCQDGPAIDDFSDCIILPALVDCSVSLSRSPSVDSRVRFLSEHAGLAEKAAMLERHIQYCHGYGVLGVADGNEITDLLQQSRGGMKQTKMIDIRASNRLDRSRKDCAPDKSTGGDFLKIGYSANIEDEEGPNPRLAYEDLCRLLQQRDGKKAVVVANGARQVAEALLAGCEAIEQGWYGRGQSQENGEKGCAVDSQRSPGQECLGRCEHRWRRVLPFLPALCGTGKAGPRRRGILEKDTCRASIATVFCRKIGGDNGFRNRSRQHWHTPWRVDNRGDEIVHQGRLFTGEDGSLRLGKWCKVLRHGEAGTAYCQAKSNLPDCQGTAQQLPRKLSYLEGIYVDGMPSTAYRKIPI